MCLSLLSVSYEHLYFNILQVRKTGNISDPALGRGANGPGLHRDTGKKVQQNQKPDSLLSKQRINCKICR